MFDISSSRRLPRRVQMFQSVTAVGIISLVTTTSAASSLWAQELLFESGLIKKINMSLPAGFSGFILREI